MAEPAELRASHMALALQMLPAHLDRRGWDAETSAAHRSQALRGLLKVAVEKSPWHRERLSGVPLDAVNPDDLSALPTMTKADVMAHFDRMVTDPRVTLRAVEDVLAAGAGAYLFNEYTAAATGGSTGARTVTLFDRTGLAAWWLSGFRSLLAWRRAQPDLRERQVIMAWVTASHASHMSALLALTFNDPSFRNISVPVTLPIEQIVTSLNDAQPDVIVAYPSAWVFLARQAEDRRLRVSPRQVWSTGEPLLPEIRSAVEATFPTPFVNRWGATETGALSEPCALGFGHLLDDLTILEPVDVVGRPVPAGQRCAKLLATNLFNHALPLIRYEITDEATMVPGMCECGSSTARVADVQGRTDESFRYPSCDIHPHVFRSALGRRPQILEYQVRQTPGGAEVSVRCAQPLELADVATELCRDLRAAGLPDPQVDVVAVDALHRLAHTGKLRRFFPLTVTS